jgi:hypothetical protein
MPAAIEQTGQESEICLLISFQEMGRDWRLPLPGQVSDLPRSIKGGKPHIKTGCLMTRNDHCRWPAGHRTFLHGWPSSSFQGAVLCICRRPDCARNRLSPSDVSSHPRSQLQVAQIVGAVMATGVRACSVHVAQVGFEPTISRVWAWRDATSLPRTEPRECRPVCLMPHSEFTELPTGARHLRS